MPMTSAASRATRPAQPSLVATQHEPITILTMASISLYILTFNCGRTFVDVDALSSQLFNALEPTNTLPDLLFISLQEIAPIHASFIGGSFLVPYFARVEDAVNKAVSAVPDSEPYNLISAKNVGMTALLAFSRDGSAVENVQTAGVGVGVMEMGNKGAVGLHLAYKSVEFTFVAAHLAAHEGDVERRNQDWKNIVRGLVFDRTEGQLRVGRDEDEQPLLSSQVHGLYKPTSHLFVAGDLNYRTSARSPTPQEQASFPQPKDDSDRLSKLFESDQLNHEKKAGRTLHGLAEAKIEFPPTYKYTSKEPYLVADKDLQRWNWATHRWPSWCDRILYLEMPSWMGGTTKGKIISQSYIALPLLPTSDHRPVASLFEVPQIPLSDPDQLDSVDPRISPPVQLDRNWKLRREKARQLELVVGFAAYFTTTLEGGSVALSTIMGIVGGFFALRILLEW